MKIILGLLASLSIVLFSACKANQITITESKENTSKTILTEKTLPKTSDESEDTMYPNLNEPIDILNLPEITFAYANNEGNKLIVIYDDETTEESNKSLTYFDYAIGREEEFFEVKYSAYQEKGVENNGRQLSINFDNEAGCLYDVVSAKVTSNDTYILLTQEMSEKIIIFQDIQKAEPSTLSLEIIQKCKSIANRNVKKSFVLSNYENGSQLSIVEFEADDKNLLAWVILSKDEIFQYYEYAAVLSEDKYTGWRLGDGGELDKHQFYSLCTFENEFGIVVYFGWYSEEVEAIIAIEFFSDMKPKGKTVSGRYIFPF